MVAASAPHLLSQCIRSGRLTQRKDALNKVKLRAQRLQPFATNHLRSARRDDWSALGAAVAVWRLSHSDQISVTDALAANATSPEKYGCELSAHRGWC